MTKKRLLKFGGIVLVLAAMLFGCWKLHSEITITVGVYAGSYWNTPNGNCYQIFDDAISSFEAAHPGIFVEYVNGIPTDFYSEWLAEGILKREEPDLFLVMPEDIELFASSGILKPLDTMMAEDPDFSPSPYYEPCLQAGKFGGTQYALPYESVPTIMFVNKTLLQQNGIPMPENNWTWDDFYRICRRITKPEKHQFGVYGYHWLHAVYSNGAALFSGDGKSCYLADQRVQDAITFSKHLDAMNQGYTVTARDFDLGNVAFRPFLFSEYRAYQPYPWRVKKYSGFEWDCVCMPAGYEGDNTSELHTMLLGISARTRHKKAVWELAKLLSIDKDVQKELYVYSHGISPVRSVAEDDEFLLKMREDIPGGGSFDGKVIRRIMDTAVVVPHFDKYEQALRMAESAVLEKSDTQMLAAQREIDIFLNGS